MQLKTPQLQRCQELLASVDNLSSLSDLAALNRCYEAVVDALFSTEATLAPSILLLDKKHFAPFQQCERELLTLKEMVKDIKGKSPRQDFCAFLDEIEPFERKILMALVGISTLCTIALIIAGGFALRDLFRAESEDRYAEGEVPSTSLNAKDQRMTQELFQWFLGLGIPFSLCGIVSFMAYAVFHRIHPEYLLRMRIRRIRDKILQEIA